MSKRPLESNSRRWMRRAAPIAAMIGCAFLLGAALFVLATAHLWTFGSSEPVAAASSPQIDQLQCVNQPANLQVNCVAASARPAAKRPSGGQRAGGSCPCEGCKDCESRVNQAIKDLEARIDKDRKDAEDRIDKDVSLAEWILGVVIALAGFVYPLLGGLAAYFQIKQAREDAEKQLDSFRKDLSGLKDESRQQVESIRKNIEQIVEEYQSNFPQFTAMDARMQRLLSEMKQRMPSEDDFNNVGLFQEMPEIDRQYIQDCEATVAAISVFDLARSPSLSARIASIYGIFARFYNLRDNTFKSPEEYDFARAVAYANRVIQLKPESSEGYRIRGAIELDRYLLLKAITPHKKAKLEEVLRSAETDLDEAIDKCTASASQEVDAGAFYNRALAYYYREEHDEAVAVSKRLLGLEKKVSRSQRERYLPSIYVNLGSFLARLAGLAATQGSAEQARLFSAEAVDAVTLGVRDFQQTTMQDGGLERLKRELASELDGKQELAQLEPPYVQQLWALAKSKPETKQEADSGTAL